MLVDGPAGITGVSRQILPLSRVSLTDLMVSVPRNVAHKQLKSEWESNEIQKKWATSSWGKKLACKKRRASLNDFERFQVKTARRARAGLIRSKLAELKNSA